MKKLKMRRAFSMLIAITAIVLVAFLSSIVLGLSGKMIKETTNQFQHEQAQLYAKSYTEYAIMALTANDRTSTCMENIDSTIGDPDNGNGYRVKVRVAFIGNGNGKGDISNCSSERQLDNSVTTPKSPLSTIIDVYVEYKDPDNTSGAWFSYHRRTLQKI
jgi:type II secretory pathway pseudopilin PulG